MKRLALLASLLTWSSLLTGLGCYSNHYHQVRLTGDQVVPPVETKAYGHASFLPEQNDTLMRYSINLQDLNLEEVTGATIHLGQPCDTGPCVATLFPHDPLPGPPSTGRLIYACLCRQDLQGPLAGKTLGALVKEMAAGNTYLVIQTRQHPQGELRGQISSRIKPTRF